MQQLNNFSFPGTLGSFQPLHPFVKEKKFTCGHCCFLEVAIASFTCSFFTCRLRVFLGTPLVPSWGGPTAAQHIFLAVCTQHFPTQRTLGPHTADVQLLNGEMVRTCTHKPELGAPLFQSPDKAWHSHSWILHMSFTFRFQKKGNSQIVQTVKADDRVFNFWKSKNLKATTLVKLTAVKVKFA